MLLMNYMASIIASTTRRSGKNLKDCESVEEWNKNRKEMSKVDKLTLVRVIFIQFLQLDDVAHVMNSDRVLKEVEKTTE